MIEQKRNKIISIAIHGAVAAVLVGILIMLCFKNSSGEYIDLAINKALSKSINVCVFVFDNCRISGVLYIAYFCGNALLQRRFVAGKI